MRFPSLLALTAVTTLGCSLSHDADDSGVASLDVAITERDAPRPDVPRDTPPPTSPLQAVLSCRFDEESALRAIVRHVSCLERRESASVGGFYEAWEAGLFSGIEPAYTSFEPGLGCEAWHCIADATSCMDAALCDTMARPCGADGLPYCQGDEFVTCGASSTGRAFDCSAVGAGCTPEGCAIDGCLFRPGESYQLSCDGPDLVLCEGAIRVDCAARGASCGSFAVGGEVPIAWCRPPGFGGAGAYGSPIECAEDGVISFTSASGVFVRFDCQDAGYSGCDEWGCLP
jgi:hypothetical protein